MKQNKVYDYINKVVSYLSEIHRSEDFKNCKFAILCDKYPIQSNFKNYIAKVMYISIKTEKNTLRIYPDTIKEFDMEYITLTNNSRRKFSKFMNEFFINGNTEEQEYNENKFYNYSIERANAKTLEIVKALREKYNLEPPQIFIGEHQDLVLE